MKKAVILRIIASMITVLMCLAMLSSCKHSDDNNEKKPDIPLKAEFVAIDSSMRPITVVNKEYSQSGIKYKLPKVVNSGRDTEINDLIMSSVEAFVAEYPRTVSSMDYSVMYNDKGILSIVILAYGRDIEYDRNRNIILNFNVAGACQLSFSDLFDLTDKNFIDTVTYYINSLASHDKIILYSDVKDLSGARFYLTETSIDIVYDLYSITSFDAGEPVFSIPYTALSKFIKPLSPIDIIINNSVVQTPSV